MKRKTELTTWGKKITVLIPENERDKRDILKRAAIGDVEVLSGFPRKKKKTRKPPRK